MIRPTAISVPLPAEVTPSTNPTSTPERDRERPCCAWSARSARARCRRALRANSARVSTAVPVNSSAAATTTSMISSNWPRHTARSSACEHVDAADRRGHRAEADPRRQAHVDRAVAQVAPAADGLRDRAVGEVGADGDDRLDAEDDDQERRHQRAAAHAGEAYEYADAEPEEDDERVHCGCSHPCRPHSVFSRLGPAAAAAVWRAACSACSRSTGSRGRAAGCRARRAGRCRPTPGPRTSRRAGSPSTGRAARRRRASTRSGVSPTARGAARPPSSPRPRAPRFSGVTLRMPQQASGFVFHSSGPWLASCSASDMPR